jgi:hypothetical protein
MVDTRPLTTSVRRRMPLANDILSGSTPINPMSENGLGIMGYLPAIFGWHTLSIGVPQNSRNLQRQFSLKSLK